ncbi:MAG: hypothetical protein ABJC24_09090 [Chloroflexota bacterium]
MEFRGAAAVAAVAVLGLFPFALAGVTVWWLSRNPTIAPNLADRKPRIWASLVLGSLVLVGLLIWALVWTLSS